MKTVAVALVALLASVSALPPQPTSAVAIVEAVIESVVNALQQRDPILVERAEGEFNFRDRVKGSAFIEAFVFTGFSNVEVNDVSLSGSVLNVALTFPGISATVGDSGAEVTVGRRTIGAQLSGSLAINDIKMVSQVDLLGFLIDGLDFDCTIGGIDSNLNVVVGRHDLSDRVNDVLGVRLPNLLKKHRDLLNRLAARAIQLILGLLF
ncbi:uncharacterized protein [Battus philenor]|uniref:uncharacterized protein n=1 Tax=Battus philenor TaxID=42288 RepID=UPI0035CF2210